MLESIRRVVTVPRVSVAQILSIGAVLTFVWLLAHDQIHPLAIYLAQIYLMF